MKIVDIIGYSLSSTYGDGNVYGQPKGVKSIGLVEVHTDAGYIGFGETYAGVYCPELISPIIKFLKEYLIGCDPIKIDDINDKLSIPFISGGGLIRSIISAIDISLWDIKGQAMELPISELINSDIKSSIKSYASSGSVAMSPEEIASDVEKILNKEYSAYKMRVGVQSWDHDLERIRVARKNLGDENQLMIDAIMGTLPNPWSYDKAQSRCNDMVPFNPLWVEEPLHPENYFGYKKLMEKTNLSIAMGESFSGLNEFETYLSNNCINYIQPDVTQCGGITQAIKIISTAKKYNVPVALHVWGSAISIISNLHLALAMSQVKWLEIPQVRLELLSDKINECISISKSHSSLTGQCGLGIKISDEEKNKYKFISGSGYKIPTNK